MPPSPSRLEHPTRPRRRRASSVLAGSLAVVIGLGYAVTPAAASPSADPLATIASPDAVWAVATDAGTEVFITPPSSAAVQPPAVAPSSYEVTSCGPYGLASAQLPQILAGNCAGDPTTTVATVRAHPHRLGPVAVTSCVPTPTAWCVVVVKGSNGELRTSSIRAGAGGQPPNPVSSLDGRALDDGNSVLLTWLAGQDVAQAEGVPSLVVTYEVRRDGHLVARGLTAPSFQDAGCGSARRCDYEVTAVSPAGRSTPSSRSVVTLGDAAPTLARSRAALLEPGRSSISGMLGQGVDDERPVTVRFTPVAGGTPSSASATSTGGSWSATVPLGLSPGRYEITAAQGGHESRVLTSVVAPDIALSASVAGAGSAASEAALPGDVVIAGQAIPTSATAPVAIVDGLVDGDRLGTDPTQAQLASVFRGLSVGRTSPTMLVPADDLGRWEGVLRVPASAAGRHVIKVTQDVPGLRQRTTYLQLTVMASTTTTSGPVVAPSAPGVPSVVAGAGRAVVRWKTPAAGSSPIAGYEVWAVDDRSKSCSVSVGASTHANRCIVRDLAQGTPYRFKVSALSAAGRSRGSAPSAPITPKGPPGVPLAPSAVAGKGSAKVSWKAPSSNGSPITAYTVTASPGGATCTTAGGSSSCKVLLTNGTAYSFTVAATNALGTSISPASTPVTPVAAPEAPSAPSVQPGSRSAVVSWSEPSSNGSPITGYAVVAKPGGKRCSTSSTTTCTITGLTNGTAYTFTVAATNALGTSTSPASSPSIPAAVPDTPTSPVATGAVGGTPARPSITVSWTAPGADGGSAVTSYVATAVQDQSKTCTAQAPSTSCTITSLPTGVTYSFTVVAVNAMGSSLPSAATAPITTASKPGAPTNVVATGGDTTVSVTWTPPVNGGGTPITSYVVKQVYTSNTCVYVVGSTPANTCTFTGLANGRWMQFTVAAVNAMGTSFDSQMSLYVTVGQGPSAPTNLVATPGNGSVVLTWDAPTAPGSKYNATSPGQRGTVTGYHVSLASGGYAYGCYVYGSGATPPPRTCTITGLRNGTSYQFVVTASNDSSAVSDASIPSDAVVPATTPSAPTGLVALASRTTAALRWSAPADTGGAPITSYVATFRPSNGASFTATFDGTATSGMVTGLTPEVTYVVTIKAVTRVGASPDSTSSTALWTERPAVPRDVTVQAQPGSAVISWTQPPSMTFPIVSYTITAIDRTDPAGSTTAVVSTNPGGIGGLVPGDTYAFTVAATNIVGTSAASSPSSAVSFAVPPAPAAASAFLYDYEPPAGEVEVTWTAPDTTGFLPITGYRITAKAPSGDPVTVEADAASTSASISGLDPWTPYAIWVSALSATGSSELASAGVVTPPGPPRKPSGFTASSEGYNLHFGFDPTGQGTDPVGTFSIVSDLGFRCWNISTSTCDAVTAYGLTQSWALVARNAWGSTSSDPVVVTPEPYGPSVPLVDPVRALDGSAAISWTAPGDFVLWDFPVGTPTWPRSFTARVVGDPSHACTVEAGQYERRYRCTIDGLTVGATYRFEVVATNEYGDATSPALTAVVSRSPTCQPTPRSRPSAPTPCRPRHPTARCTRVRARRARAPSTDSTTVCPTPCSSPPPRPWG